MIDSLEDAQESQRSTEKPSIVRFGTMREEENAPPKLPALKPIFNKQMAFSKQQSPLTREINVKTLNIPGADEDLSCYV